MSEHPWPLFDLRLRTPDLELRLPTDEDLLELVRVARQGIVDPDQTVFLVPWHRLPSPAFERQFLLHWWRSRGSWSPARWQLPLAAVVDGRPVGMQDMMATDFAITRVVTSASWLGREFHGRGFGTQMRAAMLALAFDGLGAEVAKSGYFEGNAASARQVSPADGSPSRAEYTGIPTVRGLNTTGCSWDDIDANRWISPRKSAILNGEMSRALELPLAPA